MTSSNYIASYINRLDYNEFLKLKKIFMARDAKWKKYIEFKHIYEGIEFDFNVTRQKRQRIFDIPDYNIVVYKKFRKLNRNIFKHLIGCNDWIEMPSTWRYIFYIWYTYIVHEFFKSNGKTVSFDILMECNNYFPEIVNNEFHGLNVPNNGFKIIKALHDSKEYFVDSIWEVV